MTYNSIEHWLPPRVAPKPIAMLSETDPGSYTTVTVCLPCAAHECRTCYGEGCECACEGSCDD